MLALLLLLSGFLAVMRRVQLLIAQDDFNLLKLTITVIDQSSIQLSKEIEVAS